MAKQSVKKWYRYVITGDLLNYEGASQMRQVFQGDVLGYSVDEALKIAKDCHEPELGDYDEYYSWRWDSESQACALAGTMEDYEAYLIAEGRHPLYQQLQLRVF